jgi:hypothetical protein
MNKQGFFEKTGIDPKGLEGFSEETLSEMAMENVEGGGWNISRCEETNNCDGGNCSSGCGY